MKNIILICVCILSINNCNAQKGKQKHATNKTITKKKNMNLYQYLINKSFEKINPNQREGRETLPNGNFLEVIVAKSGSSFNEIIKDSYYLIYKGYYPNGNIRNKGISFNQDTFQMGIWYEFDENGKLIKETDYDEGYDFTLENVIKFAETQKDIRRYQDINNVVFPQGEYTVLNPGSNNTIRKEIREGKNVWVLEYNFSEREQSMMQDGKIVGREYIQIYTEIVLDGKTGKILSNKRIGEKEDSVVQSEKKRNTSLLANPEEKGTYHKRELGTAYASQSELKANKNIYQTYEGRYYTKTEWDEFYKTLSWVDRLFLGKS